MMFGSRSRGCCSQVFSHLRSKKDNCDKNNINMVWTAFDSATGLPLADQSAAYEEVKNDLDRALRHRIEGLDSQEQRRLDEYHRVTGMRARSRTPPRPRSRFWGLEEGQSLDYEFGQVSVTYIMVRKHPTGAATVRVRYVSGGIQPSGIGGTLWYHAVYNSRKQNHYFNNTFRLYPP